MGFDMVYMYNYIFGSELGSILGGSTVYSTKEVMSEEELKDIVKNKLDFRDIKLDGVSIDILPPVEVSLEEFIRHVNSSNRVNF